MIIGVPKSLIEIEPLSKNKKALNGLCMTHKKRLDAIDWQNVTGDDKLRDD